MQARMLEEDKKDEHLQRQLAELKGMEQGMEQFERGDVGAQKQGRWYLGSTPLHYKFLENKKYIVSFSFNNVATEQADYPLEAVYQYLSIISWW